MNFRFSLFPSFCVRVFLIPVFITTIITLMLFWPGPDVDLGAAPLEKVALNTRCPVCGMFVAKYDVWITQLKLSDDRVLSFDGVKDMMAFHFSPDSYIEGLKESVTEVWVKDYYSLKWIDGKNAFYVKGSDVHGPMGHELIPFSSRAAAESFLADHKGKKIFGYKEITVELIEKMRSGHKMKK